MEKKLDNDQRMFVLRMHAEGYGYQDIVKEIQEKWSIKMDRKSISDTCSAKKYLPFITQFRDEYLANIKSEPIANKRVRLADLNKEVQRIEKMINSLPLNVKKVKTSDRNIYLSLCSEKRRFLAEAREEMEKRPHQFTSIAIGLGGTSDDELHQRQELIKSIRINASGRSSGALSNSGGTEEED